MPTIMSARLHVCIVLYRPDANWLRRSLHATLNACARAISDGDVASAAIDVVNNDLSAASAVTAALDEVRHQLTPAIALRQIDAPQNLGFGAGNNLALRDSSSDYVLVINPDVEMQPDALSNGIRHLAAAPDCGMVSPVAMFPDGQPQYLVKRHPGLLTLALRGFAPRVIQALFAERLARYERREVGFDQTILGCEIVSGCWMLMRGSLWRQLGGFDERFFLYFEDFDLCLRASRLARLDRVSDCRIVHAGGHAGRKGWAHIMLFSRSALMYFNKHGWRW
ncbi:MAG: glycosyltransferase [Burkholderiales bacterium]|jgi:GT2 family glycosyltransferase